MPKRGCFDENDEHYDKCLVGGPKDGKSKKVLGRAFGQLEDLLNKQFEPYVLSGPDSL